MPNWVDIVLSIAALPSVVVSWYLGVLASAARREAAPQPREPHEPRLSIDVIIPAHDEELGVAATVRSVLGVDYPKHLFRIIVVADNCRDRTAEVAAKAGAEVIERDVPERRGKGYALAFAFDRILETGFADVVVVIDADSSVSRNLLSALSARFENGAAAVQANYGVRNACSSWRTRLMHVAFTAFHSVRSLARERLSLSCGLRGNGMAFSSALLRAVPHRAFSLVEDLEYGIALGLAGIRVQHAHEIDVLGDMCETEQNSRSQRRRWEHGRRQLARQYMGTLLLAACRRRDRVLFDLAADLAVPPLSQILLIIACGLVATAVAIVAGAPIRLAPWLWMLSTAGVTTYIARAWFLSGVGSRGFADSLWVFAYLAWKVRLVFAVNAGRNEWIRTNREPKP